MAPRLRLRIEPYDPDARDADNDGIVQEGTAFERPAGTRMLTELGEEVARGLTSESPLKLRIVDGNGKDVSYTPSYGSVAGSLAQAREQKKPLRSLSERGYKSISELGYKSIGDIVNPPPRDPEPTPMDRARAALDDVVRGAPRDRVAPKRGNRDRAFAKADEKAKELVWTDGGTFWVVETERDFVVLDDASYQALLASADNSAMGQIAQSLPYNKPKTDTGPDADIKAALIGPRDIGIDDAQYRDAVVDIHHNGGNIADLPDDLFAATLFDESLTDGVDELLNDDGSPVTFESIMSGEYRPGEGFRFENRRFRITQLKDDFYEETMDGGIWRVYKFVDKETGEEWYVKASTYATNDGMLEDVGMRAGALLDLAAKPDSKHIRISPEVKSKSRFDYEFHSSDGTRTVRWTAMSSVDSWDNPDGEKLTWLDASVGGGISPESVDVGDLAQILTLDYILDNTDRHGGNIMVGWEASGVQRLAIIDNGLLMGGRTQDEIQDFENPATPEQIRMVAMKRADMTAMDLIQTDHQNNFLMMDKNVRAMYQDRLGDPDGDGGVFVEKQMEALARIKENLDSLLDPENFRARGIPLSPTEEAHLKAMKQVAQSRIEMLESYPDMLLDAIGSYFSGLAL